MILLREKENRAQASGTLWPGFVRQVRVEMERVHAACVTHCVPLSMFTSGATGPESQRGAGCVPQPLFSVALNASRIAPRHAFLHHCVDDSRSLHMAPTASVSLLFFSQKRLGNKLALPPSLPLKLSKRIKSGELIFHHTFAIETNFILRLGDLISQLLINKFPERKL